MTLKVVSHLILILIVAFKQYNNTHIQRLSILHTVSITYKLSLLLSKFKVTKKKIGQQKSYSKIFVSLQRKNKWSRYKALNMSETIKHNFEQKLNSNKSFIFIYHFYTKALVLKI